MTDVVVPVKIGKLPTIPTRTRNSALGHKPPFFLAAVRNRRDRGYEPRYDLG
jgi:hypothetical protein